MPLDKQLVSLAMIGGVDTATDPLSIKPPKLAALDNAQFTAPGRIAKRNTYAQVGTYPGGIDVTSGALISDVQSYTAVLNRREQLMLWTSIDPTYLWQRAKDNSDRWLTYGPWPLLAVRRDLPAGERDRTIVAHDACVPVQYGTAIYRVAEYADGGMVVYSWAADGSGWTGLAVSPTSALGAPTRPRLVAANNGPVCLFFVGGGNSIGFIQIPTSGTGPVSVAPTTIAADLNIADPVYDVCEYSTASFVVAYNSTTAHTIKMATVSTSGALTLATSFDALVNPSCIGLSVAPVGGSRAVVWGSTASQKTYLGFGNTSNVVTVQRLVEDGLLSGTRSNITAAWSQTAADSYAHVMFEVRGSTAATTIVGRGVVTSSTGAIVTHQHWARRHGLAAKAFSGGSAVYVPLVRMSTLQTSHVLAQSVGRASAPVAGIDPIYCGLLHIGQASGLSAYAHLPQSGDRYVVSPEAYPCVVIPLLVAPTATQKRSALVMVSIPQNVFPTAVEVGESLYVPGAILWELDGGGPPMEAEFLFFPESITGTPTNIAGGGLLPNTAYSYVICLEYVNANGERRQSAVSPPVAITTGPGENAVILTIPTHTDTNKTCWFVAFRATQASGELFQRVSAADQSVAGTNGRIQNSLTADSVTFTDGMAEATLETQEFSPDEAGTLENIAPPAHTVIGAGNGRVFLSGFAHDQHLVWFSKERQSGEPLNFSDANTIQIEQGPGPITAVAALADSIVVFRDSRTYAIGGQGPDNTGVGGTFTPGRLVNAELGAIDPGALVVCQGNAYFQSRRGIERYGPAGLEFVGQDVAGYTSVIQCVQTALAVPGTTQIRFVLGGGVSRAVLMFDYRVGAWSRWILGFTQQGGAVIAANKFHLVADTALWREQTAPAYGLTATTEQYNLALETPWLRVGALMGVQRIYKILFAGTQEGPHTVRVQIAYDDDPTWIDTFTWDPTTVTGYQFQVRPSRQKCRTIKLSLTDLLTGVAPQTADSFTLTEIAALVGVKQGERHIEVAKTATKV